MSRESKPRVVSTSLAALFMASTTLSCSSSPTAVVPAQKQALASSTDTSSLDTPSSVPATPSTTSAPQPGLIPKKLAPEQPFALAARIHEPINLGFAAGRVFALLREEEPLKNPDSGDDPNYWVHVFELRGNKFQAITKRKFKGDMNFSQIVERDGKPYLGGYNPNSRTGITEFEPIDPKGKRIHRGFGDEPETPVPPACEDPSVATSKILPMRDVYWYWGQDGTLFYMGTSCDGKANVQTVQNGRPTMMPVQPSDQLLRTDLGVVFTTASEYSLYQKNQFVRLAPALPELPRNLMRAPDGTILALGRDNYALRQDGWRQWLLEDARSEFTIVNDGAHLWAYVLESEMTELHRYAPSGSPRVEQIDTSAMRLPAKIR